MSLNEEVFTRSLSSSLVREYLHRMGLKKTLDTMDLELPREASSIYKSSYLAKELKLELFIKANKIRKNPFQSLLEIIVFNVRKLNQDNKYDLNLPDRLNSESNSFSKEERKKLSIQQLKILHTQLKHRGINIDFMKLVKINCGCLYSKGRHHYHKINDIMFANANSSNSSNLMNLTNGIYFKGNQTSLKYSSIEDNLYKNCTDLLKLHCALENMVYILSVNSTPKEKNFHANSNVPYKYCCDFRELEFFEEEYSKSSVSLESTECPKSNVPVSKCVTSYCDQKLITEEILPINNLISLLVHDEASNGIESEIEDFNLKSNLETLLLVKNDRTINSLVISDSKCDKGNRMQLERDENGEATDGFDRFEYSQKGPREYGEKVASPLTERESVLMSSISEVELLAGGVVLDPDPPKQEPNNNNTDQVKKYSLNCFRTSRSIEEEHPSTDFLPLDSSVAQQLTRILFGIDRKNSLQWVNQSFLFNNNPNLRYGFLQYKVINIEFNESIFNTMKDPRLVDLHESLRSFKPIEIKK